MTLQAKIPDLPRPAFVAPCGSTLHPAASVAAVAGHKKTVRSPRQCLPALSLLCYVVRSRCFALTRPLVHATIIAHLNVSLCLMFCSILSAPPCHACPSCFSCVSLPSSRASCCRLRLLCCLCSPVLLYWLSLPPCAPLPALCLWLLLSALLCMYCCRCSCSDLLRVRV